MKEKTVFKLHGVRITPTQLIAGLADGENVIPLNLIQSFKLAWKVSLKTVLIPFTTHMRKLVLTLTLKSGEQNAITVSLEEADRKWDESWEEKWDRENDIQEQISAALRDAISPRQPRIKAKRR